MIEKWLNEQVDDYKSVPVKDYIAMREKHFAHLEEGFSFLKPFDTIIVAALSFPASQARYKGKGYGYISRYAHGKDYHLVFGERLKAIAGELESKGIKAQANVDISPLDERFAAYLSGLGFLGHNQFLIHPTYGTHLYLGTILIDQSFKTTPYLLDDCGTCTRCIDACPGDALSPHHMDIEKCLSHITQEKRPLSTEEIPKMKSFLFGCDVCQNVCPKNKAIMPVERDVFQSDENAQIHLKSMLEISNKKLMREYRNYAFAWRGISVLKRNALAILYSQKDPELPHYLEKMRGTLPKTPWFHETIDNIEALKEGKK